MNDQEFEEWWFSGGEDEAIAKYDKEITQAEIRKQPSYKIYKDKNNAYVEAVWNKAYFDKVKLPQRRRLPRLSKEDFEVIENLINKARNSDLYKIDEMLQHEIHLSEVCIKEGSEKRR